MSKVRIHHVQTGKMLRIQNGKIEAKSDKDTIDDDSIFLKHDAGDHDHYQHHQNQDLYITISNGKAAPGDKPDEPLTKEYTGGRGTIALHRNGQYVAFDDNGDVVAASDAGDNVRLQV
eukprot:CAMPEP_0206197632 /NCGR_PEP_ID=MMETSP0166-20121206/9164_1 /ASSEMBLY_ACC=CAM_ASM_000260 /TAXON_ID=95228 /ORGANISM="Vannella robusta, Strain DIVA3 518/3/11/1/6" /LENGTH=117 /DNA_ID=CAMNT_0053615345 /DNA_START=1 /DNA_END=350 /DNA_ORIENTATION=+